MGPLLRAVLRTVLGTTLCVLLGVQTRVLDMVRRHVCISIGAHVSFQFVFLKQQIRNIYRIIHLFILCWILDFDSICEIWGFEGVLHTARCSTKLFGDQKYSKYYKIL